MTKAILDVDDCAEGMRKFTTEVFDTGVALAAYAGMLLVYDVRLALIAMIFPPISYMLAEKMKIIVQRTGAEYKRQSGILSNATLDRASNAITYRVYGREEDRRIAYEDNLSSYEKAAIRANLWIYRQKRCRQDYLYENDRWSGKADKRRDIHVWIRWKGFVKGTLKSGLSD